MVVAPRQILQPWWRKLVYGRWLYPKLITQRWFGYY
jgi:hypothetical protein